MAERKSEQERIKQIDQQLAELKEGTCCKNTETYPDRGIKRKVSRLLQYLG